MITAWAIFTAKVLAFAILAAFWFFVGAAILYGVLRFVMGIIELIEDYRSKK